MSNLLDFLDSYEFESEEEIDQELIDLDNEFRKKFNTGIGLYMIPDGISDDQIKEAVKECLDSGEDKLFEILGVKTDPNSLY